VSTKPAKDLAPLFPVGEEAAAAAAAEKKAVPVATKPAEQLPAQEDVAAAPKVPAKAPRLETLDGPRYIASISIVLYHYYGYDDYAISDYLILGGLWTQFFFVLAGFVLGYVEMV
jgi:hypothetical protein